MHGILNNQDCRQRFLMHEYGYDWNKNIDYSESHIFYVRSAGVVWWPPFMIRIEGPLKRGRNRLMDL